MSDARRLKTLEDGSARLKKLLVEQMLGNAILKDVVAKMLTPDTKRNAVAHACMVHAASQRRACLALKIDRSTVRYTSTQPDDALLRDAMKAEAGERRRFTEARSAITSWKEDYNHHRPPLGPRQHDARRVRPQIHAGKAVLIQPEINPGLSLRPEEKKGLRSATSYLGNPAEIAFGVRCCQQTIRHIFLRVVILI